MTLYFKESLNITVITTINRRYMKSYSPLITRITVHKVKKGKSNCAPKGAYIEKTGTQPQSGGRG